MTPENAPEVAEESVASELSSEDILAELAASRLEDETPAEDTEEEPETDDEPEEGDDEDGSEDEDEDDDLDEDEDDDEDEDEDDEDDEPDEKDLKGLAKIKAAEKSFTKRMQAQKAELQADKDKWLERVEAAEKAATTQAEYKSLANSNPVALFEDLGVEGSEAFTALGKYFFQYGKGIAPDASPQDKQAAESIQRLREQTAGLKQTKAEIAELKKKLEEKDQAAEHSKTIQAFQTKLGRIASKKFPLAAKILGSDAKDEAQEQMLEIARDIARTTKQEPSAQKVLKRYEAAERRRLKARGIDVDALTTTTATKKKNPDKAAKKKPVPTPETKTNSSDDDELSMEDQILRDLQEARARGEVV